MHPVLDCPLLHVLHEKYHLSGACTKIVLTGIFSYHQQNNLYRKKLHTKLEIITPATYY
jgi:hypothetical protein